MPVISSANRWFTEGDPLCPVYRMVLKSCAVDVYLTVGVGLYVFLLPVHMGWGGAIPFCTAAGVLLHNCC